MQQIEHIKEFGGWLNRYRHESDVCNCTMTFSIYLPPQAPATRVPVVYWLSGLTCSDDNARTKAGMQRYAAELGLAIVFPDTSPRGADVADDRSRWDLGKGAGFYVNSTREPWSAHYRMYDYVTRELPAIIESEFPVIENRRSISGHSMGGHGALICALKNPGFYRSVSAFSPICNPTLSGWGKGCFSAYLGDDEESWREYDATFLIEDGAQPIPLLIDCGSNDEYLADQLYIDSLVTACRENDFPLNLRMQRDYDHSYHFVSSFIGEHLACHAEALRDDQDR
jgi:S-formylglutathione hydrolase